MCISSLDNLFLNVFKICSFITVQLQLINGLQYHSGQRQHHLTPCTEVMSLSLTDQSHLGPWPVCQAQQSCKAYIYRAFSLLRADECVSARRFKKNWSAYTEGEKHTLFVQPVSLSFKYIIQATFNFTCEVETRLSNMPSDGRLFILEAVCAWKPGKGLDTVCVWESDNISLQDSNTHKNTGKKTKDCGLCVKKHRETAGV